MNHQRVVVAVLVTLASLAGCGTEPFKLTDQKHAGPVRYESGKIPPENAQMVLQCAGSSWVASKCDLLTQQAGKQVPDHRSAVMFVALRPNQQHLKRLIGESVSESLAGRGGKLDPPIFVQDYPLLQRVRQSQDGCVAEAELADLIVACPIVESTGQAIVLFIRGLCDSCRFAPVVLRKTP